ncbi:sigma-54-dependent transcriptional regulator, partial [Desulfothermus okinawensis]
MTKILIVDDDSSIVDVLDIALENEGYKTFKASNIKDGKRLLLSNIMDLVVLDIKLGNENGLDLLKFISKELPHLPVLMITAFADPKTAVKAMKLGAKDYIPKPFDIEEFLLVVKKTIEKSRLEEENIWLKKELKNKYGQIIGNSRKMQDIFTLINKIAPTNINVLITGESGTGKELIARAIHENSNRKDYPFVAINCGGVPDELVESELFGYRKGAFTGAVQSKKGLLQKAHKGTFLLDEVGEISQNIQIKLLRCIQDGTFIPLGSLEEIKVDVRFIGATNRDIEEEVSKGTFREDLFYRLSGMILHVPPLREREEDILLLAEHFLKKFSKEQNKNIKGFSKEAQKKLMSYEYPGNVRELENLIERAVALESTS